MRITLFLTGWIAAVLTVLAGGAAVAAEPPRIDQVGMVAPDIIGITISAGRVEYGRQEPYVKQPGDFVGASDIHRFVARGGKVIGTLVGKDADILCNLDEVIGDRLDTAWADRPASYEVTSADDPRFKEAQRPAAVHRKTKPSDLAMIGPYKFDSPTESIVYLKMAAPLEAGKSYTVSFEQSSLEARTFTFDPTRLRSEAVHVSQIGFRPDDPAKVAFLSAWLGSGGGFKYEEGLPFSVIDDATGEPFFEGRTGLSKAATDRTEDAWKKNYNGTDVFVMDFTGLARPGSYRISVKGLGCSYPFTIGDDVWRKAFITSARGFYHQRSGIPLGPPYTTYTRRRPFHPDDGLKVYASKAPLIDTGNGLNQKDSNFGNLVKGKTDEIVPDAWGGYMDAGDWDRRVQHLKPTRLFLELAELFPDYFASVPLEIPESGNGLPDIVNEALWNLDFYRRLQGSGGGIRGGIESSEHPRRGEASYQESLAVMAYAPDGFSSYVYAGTAARAARWLDSRDAKRAAVYRESAERAMAWAEGDREREEKEYLMARHPAVVDARNYAAAELFCLSGEGRWNELFVATTTFKSPGASAAMNWDSLDQVDAAWVYARTDRPGMDQAIKRNCRDALIREADDRAASVDRTGFRWAKHPYAPVIYGALTSPEACVNVVRAHVLTGDPKYLKAVVLASQTGVGANPVNMCYTTGLGRRSPSHPLQIDHRITRQAPPPGLTVGGPMDNTLEGLKDPFIGPFAGSVFHPPYQEWPALEAFWDVFWDPMVCEYTVHKPMAGTAYVWGYLAARAAITKPAEKSKRL
jgi:endoglucanase